MATPLETESTLTERYQTTVPEDDDDPALGRFLAFLVQDIANHHHLEQIRAIDNGLMGRIQSLVGDIEVDLDAPLPAEQE